MIDDLHERAARFFGLDACAWFAVPRIFVELPQVRGTLKYRDRCVALVDGTAGLWPNGRRDYDPDLIVDLSLQLRKAPAP